MPDIAINPEVLRQRRLRRRALVSYDWPGNVRELAHVMQRAVLLARGESIEVADLRLAIERPKQDRRRLVVAHELAAVHVPVAGTVLQRYPPLPAGSPRVGLSGRSDRLKAARADSEPSVRVTRVALEYASWPSTCSASGGGALPSWGRSPPLRRRCGKDTVDIGRRWLPLASSPSRGCRLAPSRRRLRATRPCRRVAQDTKRAGQLLVQTLVHLIEGEPVEWVTLPPRLIVRGSCEPLRCFGATCGDDPMER